jgi:hypothetical protein
VNSPAQQTASQFAVRLRELSIVPVATKGPSAATGPSWIVIVAPIIAVTILTMAVAVTMVVIIAVAAVTGAPHRACNCIGCEGGREQDSEYRRCYSGKSSASRQKLSPIFILVGQLFSPRNTQLKRLVNIQNN